MRDGDEEQGRGAGGGICPGQPCVCDIRPYKDYQWVQCAGTLVQGFLHSVAAGKGDLGGFLED